MLKTISIRQAVLEDAPAMVQLGRVLDRQDSSSSLLDGLRRLLGDEREAIFVAFLASGLVVGWIHASEQEALGSGLRCEISGLVVGPEHRREGIGRALMRSIEAWCGSRGLTQISVRSNIHRAASKSFYPALGYSQVKTQHNYRKNLNQEP